ncbi:hypothetical protein AAC387_Pa04g1578 [Persea americana]
MAKGIDGSGTSSLLLLLRPNPPEVGSGTSSQMNQVVAPLEINSDLLLRQRRPTSFSDAEDGVQIGC